MRAGTARALARLVLGRGAQYLVCRLGLLAGLAQGWVILLALVLELHLVLVEITSIVELVGIADGDREPLRFARTVDLDALEAHRIIKVRKLLIIDVDLGDGKLDVILRDLLVAL